MLFCMIASAQYLVFYYFVACNSECCQLGGHCASPVFDDCSGSWDYRTSCSPSYDTCCLSKETTINDRSTVQTTHAESVVTVQTTQSESNSVPVRSTTDSHISFPPPVSGLCSHRKPTFYSHHCTFLSR